MNWAYYNMVSIYFINFTLLCLSCNLRLLILCFYEGNRIFKQPITICFLVISKHCTYSTYIEISQHSNKYNMLSHDDAIWGYFWIFSKQFPSFLFTPIESWINIIQFMIELLTIHEKYSVAFIGFKQTYVAYVSML